MTLSSGHTPLHCAVLTHNSMRRELNHDLTISPERQKELERRIVEVMACIKLLVQAGANVTSQVGQNSHGDMHFLYYYSVISIMRQTYSQPLNSLTLGSSE